MTWRHVFQDECSSSLSPRTASLSRLLWHDCTTHLDCAFWSVPFPCPWTPDLEHATLTPTTLILAMNSSSWALTLTALCASLLIGSTSENFTYMAQYTKARFNWRTDWIIAHCTDERWKQGTCSEPHMKNITVVKFSNMWTKWRYLCSLKSHNIKVNESSKITQQIHSVICKFPQYHWELDSLHWPLMGVHVPTSYYPSNGTNWEEIQRICHWNIHKLLSLFILKWDTIATCCSIDKSRVMLRVMLIWQNSTPTLLSVSTSRMHMPQHTLSCQVGAQYKLNTCGQTLTMN